LLSSDSGPKVSAMTLQDGPQSGRTGPLPDEPKVDKVRCMPSPKVKDSASRGTLSPRQKQDCLFAAEVALAKGIETRMHGMVFTPPSVLESRSKGRGPTAEQDVCKKIESIQAPRPSSHHAARFDSGSTRGSSLLQSGCVCTNDLQREWHTLCAGR